MEKWFINALLTIGSVWGVLGFVVWVSYSPGPGSLFGTESLWKLLLYVITPALFFIFASIISAITDVHSNI